MPLTPELKDLAARVELGPLGPGRSAWHAESDHAGSGAAGRPRRAPGPAVLACDPLRLEWTAVGHQAHAPPDERRAAHAHGERRLHRRHARLHDERRLVPHGLASGDPLGLARARGVRTQALQRHACLGGDRGGGCCAPRHGAFRCGRHPGRPVGRGASPRRRPLRRQLRDHRRRPRGGRDRGGVIVEPGDALLVRTGHMHFLRRGEAAVLHARARAVDAVDHVAARPRRRRGRDRHDDVRGLPVRGPEGVHAGAHDPAPRHGPRPGQNWHLDDLAADCATDGQYDFLLVATPLPLTGAVGAPVAPTAIK